MSFSLTAPLSPSSSQEDLTRLVPTEPASQSSQERVVPAEGSTPDTAALLAAIEDLNAQLAQAHLRIAQLLAHIAELEQPTQSTLSLPDSGQGTFA